MKLAGSVELVDVLAGLAKERPVFHSEADFQHAFAWQAHAMDPDIVVRLETNPEPGVHLDVKLTRRDLDMHTAIELKYAKADWSGEHDGEAFVLKNRGAQDITGYDFVHDIHRVERFVAGNRGWNGAAIMLTNEPSYWNAPGHNRETNAAAFRIYEGLTLAGTRAWGPNTGAGTKRGREADVVLRDEYELCWANYSLLPGTRGRFRCLVIKVT